jgi:hypothetical protein
VAPELFYIYGPPNSETSLERVQRRHLYTKEADAYLVGKVAQLIWSDKWNKDLFKGPASVSIFLYELYQLINKDPRKRPLLVSILEIFTSKPHNMELPDCCFRYEI